MNRIIKFSQKEFSRKVLLIVIIPLILCFILVFFLREYKELIYFLSVLSCFITILILFYKIRYYPYIIVISNDSINIEYLNKSFFRIKTFKGNVSQLNIVVNPKQIFLFNQKLLIAKINENSINKEDKEFLIDCFEKKNR
ncbi:MAG: hypothetical protein ACOXZH_10110 [Bacteroidales bacterium]|jgi:hypothetical protein